MNGISNVNTQSIHKVSKSIVSEMQPDNTALPQKVQIWPFQLLKFANTRKFGGQQFWFT